MNMNCFSGRISHKRELIIGTISCSAFASFLLFHKKSSAQNTSSDSHYETNNTSTSINRTNHLGFSSPGTNTSNNKHMIFSHPYQDSHECNRSYHLATSPSPHIPHATTNNKTQTHDNKNQITKSFDFIIVGHGNAGAAALAVLAKKCPNASVLVVDPLSPPPNETKNVDYLPASVTSLNPNSQIIHCQTNDDIITMKYRHSLLIATGSRGAPPPSSLIHPNISQRVLELKSTQQPATVTKSPTSKQSLSNTQKFILSYPILSPSTVRQITLMASSQDAKICILGSGILALDLAVSSQLLSPTFAPHTSSSSSSSPSQHKVCLAFGQAAPLVHTLPRYLSLEISKRLRAYGVVVNERCLVSYVDEARSNFDKSDEKYGENDRKSKSYSDLQVHFVRMMDSLDSKRFQTDLLVVAPDTNDQRGSAAVTLNNTDNQTSSMWWSSLSQSSPVSAKKTTFHDVNDYDDDDITESSNISCYAGDARILVNKELHVSNNIYAAGSVARYPDDRLGHAAVTGGDILTSQYAGTVAAYNMIEDFKSRHPTSKKRLRSSHEDMYYHMNKLTFPQRIPVWHTDISYPGSQSFLDDKNVKRSALYTIGIRAIFIGTCDSDSMSTLGFWWTNQRRRQTRVKISHDNNHEDDTSNVLRNKHSNKSPSLLPVYGHGIVFYVDRSGALQGVMMWGFGNGDNNIDNLHDIEVVRKIKNMIRRGLLNQKQGENITDNVSLYYAESSKLAKLAASSLLNHRSGKIFNSPPLCRYTHAKPLNIENKEYLNPNQFKRNHNERFDMNQRRPPKEDPLWNRKEEFMKTQSLNDVIGEQFMNQIRMGKFADGTDPFQK